MAARKVQGEIPEGAVRLSEEDAVSHQWRFIMNWTPQSDVRIFRHGVAVIAGSCALSSIYINNYYRKKLRLGNFGRFSTYLPIVVMPSVMATLYHQQYVSNDIIIQKTECPICLEMRAAAIQMLFSVLIPTIMAPLTSFPFALRHYTYNIPSVIHQPKETFKLWQKFTRPVGQIFFSIALMQAFLAMGITYYEGKTMDKLQTKLQDIEDNPYF